VKDENLETQMPIYE